jgi:hypothetical protein
MWTIVSSFIILDDMLFYPLRYPFHGRHDRIERNSLDFFSVLIHSDHYRASAFLNSKWTFALVLCADTLLGILFA